MAEAALKALRVLRERTIRGPGRPRKGEVRYVHRVQVRLSLEELAILERAAQIERRNNSEFARLAILDAAHRVILEAGNETPFPGGDE